MNKPNQPMPGMTRYKKRGKGKKKSKNMQKIFNKEGVSNLHPIQPFVKPTTSGITLTSVQNPSEKANAAPFSPNIKDPVDFTKDCIDLVDDTASKALNVMLFTSNMATSVANTVTSTFVPGTKIPVRMRTNVTKSPITSNILKTTKEEGPSANQQLKDCLSSDIYTAVKDNIKANETKQVSQFQQAFQPSQQQQQQQQQQMNLLGSFPSGVPRTFLTRSHQIEPQTPAPVQPALRHFIPTIQSNQPITHSGFVQRPTFASTTQSTSPVGLNTPTFAQKGNSPSRYSPTDLYDDLDGDQKKEDQTSENREDSQSPGLWKTGEKRVSAFDRLGPISEQKKPKLTINLSFDKEQAVREVVEETPQEKKVFVPVHEREDILSSTDETVMKYVVLWPWAKNLLTRRSTKSKLKFPLYAGSDTSASVGHSKTAMLMVKEQMDEAYQRDNSFVAVTVTGYPPSWTKENVLDVMLENLKGKTFIPCFIEFDHESCKFVVIRCRQALLAIHDLDFVMQKDGVQLYITISQIVLTVMQLDFIPRLILRKRLAMVYEGTRLNLSKFTLQPDISHFIYYPLSHITNQIELMVLQTDVIWSNLTALDLMGNRLTTIEGFDMAHRMPKLKSLNLSHNCIEKASILLCCRRLALRSLWLEGNPLCHDYIESDHYVSVMKMMFPMLTLLDDMPINLKGDLPHPKPNYCPHDSVDIVNKFLQIYIPLIDSNTEDRVLLRNLYADDALTTITFRPKFGMDPELKYSRSLFIKSRVILEGNLDYCYGQTDIEKLLRRWPNFEHDPSSFTIDVFFHDETSTIFRIDGILKLLADSLAENDQLVAFSKTIHLQTSNQLEYKIKNEMIYWDEPTEEYASAAFRRTAVQRKPLSFKFDIPPDDESKKRLISTFRKITLLEEKPSIRCLELKDWDLREALEYFMRLYKVDNLMPLMKEESDN